MTQDQDATAAVATVADKSGELWSELLGKVASCFPRRETRQNAAEMVGGLLMELEDYNCQPVAEAVGHRGPHRLQHRRGACSLKWRKLPACSPPGYCSLAANP